MADDRSGYEQRMRKLGFDVTQLVADDDGTIPPPASVADARRVMASLPPLYLGRVGDGPSGTLRVGEVLGEGGMGVVSSVRDAALGREVAVKRPVRDGERGALELIREARVTGGLAHPNVVPVYSLGTDDSGAPLMVMKRIEGRLWSDVLEEEQVWPVPADRLAYHIEVLMHVCNALAFAHSRGVVHRDVKPDNVMIGDFGEVFLMDWGIAVSTEAADDDVLPRAASVDYIAGTPAYMAPEMAAADGAQIGPRSDVYLLGAVLHELLTGNPPHDGATIGASLASAFMGRAPVFAPSVPPELAAMCARALSRRPADRQPSALAFRQELADCLTHRTSRELEREAEARLAELEPLLWADTAPRDVHRLATEARFGFRQALRAWSGNEAAEAGLRRLVERMAAYHLARGARDEAAVLLDELTDPPPELLARLRRIDDARRAAEAEKARLSAMARDVDVKEQAPERVRMALGLTAIIVVVSLSFTAIRWLDFSVGYREIVGGLLLLLGACGLLLRRLRGRSPMSLKFVRAVAAVLVTLVALNLLSSAMNLPLEQALALALLSVAGASLVSAVTLHRGFVITAGVYACALVGLEWLPGDDVVWFCLGHIGGFASMAFVWRLAAAPDAGP